MNLSTKRFIFLLAPLTTLSIFAPDESVIAEMQRELAEIRESIRTLQLTTSYKASSIDVNSLSQKITDFHQKLAALPQIYEMQGIRNELREMRGFQTQEEFKNACKAAADTNKTRELAQKARNDAELSSMLTAKAERQHSEAVANFQGKTDQAAKNYETTLNNLQNTSSALMQQLQQSAAAAEQLLVQNSTNAMAEQKDQAEKSMAALIETNTRAQEALNQNSESAMRELNQTSKNSQAQLAQDAKDAQETLNNNYNSAMDNLQQAITNITDTIADGIKKAMESVQLMHDPEEMKKAIEALTNLSSTIQQGIEDNKQLSEESARKFEKNISEIKDTLKTFANDTKTLNEESNKAFQQKIDDMKKGMEELSTAINNHPKEMVNQSVVEAKKVWADNIAPLLGGVAITTGVIFSGIILGKIYFTKMLHRLVWPESVSYFKSSTSNKIAKTDLLYNPSTKKKLFDVIDSTLESIKQGRKIRPVLLTGPAGTGKTLLCRYIAQEISEDAQKGLAVVSLPMIIGMGSKGVTEFERILKRCVQEGIPMLVDEAEDLFRCRTTLTERTEENSNLLRLITTFLRYTGGGEELAKDNSMTTQVINFVKNEQQMPQPLIFATGNFGNQNYVFKFDPAMERRFLQLPVDLPCLDIREKTIKLYLAKEAAKNDMKLENTICEKTIKKLAKDTEGFAQADIAACIETACSICSEEGVLKKAEVEKQIYNKATLKNSNDGLRNLAQA